MGNLKKQLDTLHEVATVGDIQGAIATLHDGLSERLDSCQAAIFTAGDAVPERLRWEGRPFENVSQQIANLKQTEQALLEARQNLACVTALVSDVNILNYDKVLRDKIRERLQTVGDVLRKEWPPTQ